MTRSRQNPAAAFTLIELITVVIILGVLASLAVPVYLNHKVDAANAVDEAVIALIKDTANRLHLQRIAASGGADTSWPDGATLLANITQPPMTNGYVTGQWCYISTSWFIIFFCPHTDLSNRGIWLLFTQDLSSFYTAGSWLSIYSGGHG
ncbi:MAG TPA: prepilin-type N-terminal cleavage/methylation domain-containing protein [Phycisphaerae bacterium]|nr:prepilin-type N-terminal cleavage/methylation domain-containing protein [Phycisphaerae bacterium]